MTTDPLSPDQLAAYLERLGLPERPSPTLAGLAAVQRAHMQAVPFENLDVFLGCPLSLAIDDLFDKVVARRRGGYCFELNTLYAALLRTLGFGTTPVMARVWLRDPPATPTRNHLAHLVTLGGRRYLSDVGFGGYTARQPVDVDAAEPTDDGEGRIRVVDAPPYGRMLQRELDGVWGDQYSFDGAHVAAQDVVAANHFMQTHPLSHFRENRFAARFTPTGRRGLFDAQLTRRSYNAETGQHDRKEETVPLDDSWLVRLESDFGIRLPGLTPAERARLLQPHASAPEA